jgi:hypothetical protein
MIYCAKKPRYCVCEAKHVGLYDVITLPVTRDRKGMFKIGNVKKKKAGIKFLLGSLTHVKRS